MPHTVTISDESYEYLQQQTEGKPYDIDALLYAIIAEDRERWQTAFQNEEPTDARND